MWLNYKYNKNRDCQQFFEYILMVIPMSWNLSLCNVLNSFNFWTRLKSKKANSSLGEKFFSRSSGPFSVMHVAPFQKRPVCGERLCSILGQRGKLSASLYRSTWLAFGLTAWSGLLSLGPQHVAFITPLLLGIRQAIANGVRPTGLLLLPCEWPSKFLQILYGGTITGRSMHRKGWWQSAKVVIRCSCQLYQLPLTWYLNIDFTDFSCFNVYHPERISFPAP